MNKYKIFALTIVALFVSACSLNRTTLTDDSSVSIERLHTNVRGIQFHDVHAYKEGNELVVSGNVKRRYTSVTAGSGHVDVAVITPDGKVVEYVSTAYSPKVISKRSHPGSHFEVRLPVVPQDGSVVRVAIHQNTASGKAADSGFDCGKNIAVTG